MILPPKLNFIILTLKYPTSCYLIFCRSSVTGWLSFPMYIHSNYDVLARKQLVGVLPRVGVLHHFTLIPKQNGSDLTMYKYQVTYRKFPAGCRCCYDIAVDAGGPGFDFRAVYIGQCRKAPPLRRFRSIASPCVKTRKRLMITFATSRFGVLPQT